MAKKKEKRKKEKVHLTTFWPQGQLKIKGEKRGGNSIIEEGGKKKSQHLQSQHLKKINVPNGTSSQGILERPHVWGTSDWVPTH
jgi:hypothetical protein